MDESPSPPPKQNPNQLSPQDLLAAMQMMDGMNEGGRGKNRRKNRVRITIKQQAVDGEEQEFDPTKMMMGMNAQTI